MHFLFLYPFCTLSAFLNHLIQHQKSLSKLDSNAYTSDQEIGSAAPISFQVQDLKFFLISDSCGMIGVHVDRNKSDNKFFISQFTVLRLFMSSQAVLQKLRLYGCNALRIFYRDIYAKNVGSESESNNGENCNFLGLSGHSPCD